MHHLRITSVVFVTAIATYVVAACGSAQENGVSCSNSGVSSQSTITCSCQGAASGPADNVPCAAKSGEEFCCADPSFPNDRTCNCRRKMPFCEDAVYECRCFLDDVVHEGSPTACYPGGKTSPTTTGGSCCLQTSGRCACTDDPACKADETQVSECSATTMPGYCRGLRLVDSCRGLTATSSSSSSSSSGTSGTTGTSGSSGVDTSCRGRSNIGVCGPTDARCECNTTCLRLSVGSYKCGFDCKTDGDCADKLDPQSGDPVRKCSPPAGTNFNGLCVKG